MKIPPRQADAFAKAPPASARAVLVYGPDAGLARERAAALVASVVPDASDPFRVSSLTAAMIREAPGRLLEEAAAQSLTGGRRVVRVDGAEDALAPAFKAFLDRPVGDALVIATAGNLGAASRLRRLFEADRAAGAALACYSDDEAALKSLIRAVLGEASVTADRDVVDWLAAHMGADRELTRRELEKLVLYAGPGGAVTLADARRVVGDSGAMSMDDALHAAADGQAGALDQALDRLWADGVMPISVLRATANHLLRLQQIRLAREAGDDVNAAMRALRPPVFWKVADRFRRQTQTWDRARIGRGLALLLAAESACKRGRAHPQTLCSRAMHQISAQARRRA